ncbi:SLAM family member 5-like isoform X6 [Ctenopharyngodon idella]|uniref:SLAM family member 5-like isoform X6 n=1 Tax=Ctenopharyngodon idella TaxID=7959 RepID=UPI00223159C0|nr:SLAM family member 5-like isoform X6 [Ctenopharyngodon idella]
MICVLSFCFLLFKGVSGAEDAVKTLSVTEGDSVTLHAGLTETQKDDLILWTFGPDSTRIAQINKMINKVSLYNDALDGRFRDRLKLDDQTGSLTITNTTNTDSGLYKLQIFGGKEVPPKKFSIIVSARLPIPVISRDCSSSSSSSSCLLLCSAVNVGHVTLSWYKGNSLLSSISVSDLSISLSLPLEVEYQDKNTYSCVLNNPISNQTQHLDITHLCHTCSAPGFSAGVIALVCVCALAVAAGLCGFYYYHQHKMSKQADQVDQPDEEHIQLTNDGDTSNKKRNLQNSVFVTEDKITSVPVMDGQSVTLPTEITEIQQKEMICWKFANYKECSCAKFVVIATLYKANNEEHPYNRKILKFRDSLKLNHKTGSLTISNITPKHYGHYKLQITSEGQMTIHTFFVSHVPLHSEQTPTQRRQT